MDFLQSSMGKAGKFIRRPFSADMDLMNWTLFLVFVVTVAVFWRQILRHITD